MWNHWNKNKSYKFTIVWTTQHNFTTNWTWLQNSRSYPITDESTIASSVQAWNCLLFFREPTARGRGRRVHWKEPMNYILVDKSLKSVDGISRKQSILTLRSKLCLQRWLFPPSPEAFHPRCPCPRYFAGTQTCFASDTGCLLMRHFCACVSKRIR